MPVLLLTLVLLTSASTWPRAGATGRASRAGSASTSARTAAGADCATIGPDCRMTVVAPIAGSPAEKSGLLAGDVITAVDGSTVDGQTLHDNTVTIRDRDTLEQWRVKTDDVVEEITPRVEG